MKQIRQLIIFSGPSSSGKSTLIRKIQKNSNLLCDQLQIKYPPFWTYINAKDLVQIPLILPPNIIVHYDICEEHLWKKSLNLQKLVSESEQITFVTLCLSSKNFNKRMKLRIVRKFLSLLVKPRNYSGILIFLINNWKKYKKYNDPSMLINLYEEWFDFCHQFPLCEHLLIDSNKSNLKVHSFKDSSWSVENYLLVNQKNKI